MTKKNKKVEKEQMVTTYTSEISEDKIPALKEHLHKKGFLFKEAPHTFFSASSKKAKLSLKAYLKGTLLVQGKGTEEFIKFYLEPVLLKEIKFGYEEILQPEKKQDKIGVDESGKGDYFGPLVIAGVYLPKGNIDTLKKMGVKDSKKLSPKKILNLAPKITSLLKTSKVTIMPQKYNSLFRKIQNLNRMLAWGHARVIENLLNQVQCKEVLIDKFGNENLVKNALLKKGKEINLSQRIKAESDLAVAAASIIAKAEFLKRLEEISKNYAIELPKGAGSKVDELGKKIVAKNGQDILEHIAKTHFRNTTKIL